MCRRDRWYTYANGFNRALNEAINEILKRDGHVSLDDAQVVYDQHLAPKRLSDRVEEVGNQVSDEISAVTALLDDALKSAGAYGSRLEGANNSLSTAQDPASIAAVVKNLITETRQMQQYNAELETKLQDSRHQIADLKESLEVIRFESLTDELTGISNRKHFDHTIRRAIDEAEDTGLPLSLVLSDIDHFKKFNDTHGHQTGDQVLRLVGQTLKSNVKGRDLAARYGGEEFAIILPRTSLKDAVSLAENMRKAVRGKELVKRSTGENLGRVTMSFGIVTYEPGETLENLVHRADVCLYAAKGAGRDCVKHEAEDDIDALSRVA